MDETVLKLLVLKELLSQSASDDSSLAKNTSLIEVGLKVVRGPDWKWENQDGGEGHVGTIVEIGRSTLDKQVFVVWDNGFRGNYRIGSSNAYDLRTLDNGSIGVNHSSVNCNSCRKKGLIGMRWKCKVCYDFDLCTRCYMSDKHDLTHPFIRFQTSYGNQVDIPKRQGSVKVLMKGIFASAKVVRGHDWKWERQDGGNKTGIVTDVCGWDDNTDWNACHVTWSHNESTNMYRIGYDGKVDIKYTEDVPDGFYYRDHLPITGDEKQVVKEQASGNTQVKEVYRRSSETLSREETKKNIVKEFGSSTGIIHLSNSLEELYHSGQFCDFIISVKGREFPIHKAILAARSPVFSSMFLHDMKEKITGMADISDCDINIFEDFLFYLYSGKSERISSSNVTRLYDVAEKYDVQCLKKDCVSFMKRNLTVDLVCDVLTIAVKYTDIGLLEDATEFFIENAPMVLLTTKWQNFVIENPVSANEIYIKAFCQGK